VNSASSPAVILVRPQEEGNVGAAARAMANMGLDELVLVEPAVEVGDLARRFAVGAGHVLDGLRRETSLHAALGPFQRAVGTTSGRDRLIAARAIAPRELPAALAADPPATRTALVFGPEASGLTGDELALLHPWVSVPCAPVQPTLNLAQAVLIVAYELRVANPAAPSAAPSFRDEPPATTAELEGFFAQLAELLERGGFARDDTYAGALRDLRQLCARAAPSAREVAILRGVCRRLAHAIARAPGDTLRGP
jgi:tRNA (cytidine32/uridine32-2'-O)-methyltransferase